MKVTALKEILEQRININGCEDYENTFARMESDCTSRFGFKALMKSISCTEQSNLILHFLTLQNALTGPEACKCKCNLFTHGAPRSLQELVQKCPCIPDRIGIWKCWFLRRGENRSTRRKTSRSRVENQQQTHPRYDAGSGNRARVVVVPCTVL